MYIYISIYIYISCIYIYIYIHVYLYTHVHLYVYTEVSSNGGTSSHPAVIRPWPGDFPRTFAATASRSHNQPWQLHVGLLRGGQPCSDRDGKMGWPSCRFLLTNEWKAQHLRSEWILVDGTNVIAYGTWPIDVHRTSHDLPIETGDVQ